MSDATYDPTTPGKTQNSLWKALKIHFPLFKKKSPENIAVDDRFLRVVFKPILPDSFLLKQSQQNGGGFFSRLIKAAATVALIAEVVVREIASQFLSLGIGIGCYLLYNRDQYKDQAALYQLRLNMNRYAPLGVLKNKFSALIGGY